MRNVYEVLKKPIVSEKAVILMEDNKYSFVVDKDANKIEIKHAVEKAFKVTVLNVTTRNLKGKVKRMGRYVGQRPNTKRAIVTLKPGDKIEMFTGL